MRRSLSWTARVRSVGDRSRAAPGEFHYEAGAVLDVGGCQTPGTDRDVAVGIAVGAAGRGVEAGAHVTVCGEVSAGYRHLKCQWCSLGDLVVGTDGWCSPVADMGDERPGHSHADCYRGCGVCAGQRCWALRERSGFAGHGGPGRARCQGLGAALAGPVAWLPALVAPRHDEGDLEGLPVRFAVQAGRQP
jgi:hypothetical protein